MSTSSIQDRHLDTLLSMALEQLEQEENEQWITSADPQVEVSQALRLDQAFSSALREMDRGKKRQKRIQRKKAAVRALRLTAAICAGMILLALVAFPVALAASGDFRNSVMKLLMEFDPLTSSVTYQFLPAEEAEGTSPDGFVDPTPKQWRGTHFPAYVPEGFLLSACEESPLQATFASPAGGRFTFSENSGPMPETQAPEGSFFILEFIRGSDSPVVEEPLPEGGTRITVTWEDQSHWYRLIAENMDRQEVLRIANSTDECVGGSVLNLDPPVSAPMPLGEGVPDWWQGSYFPMGLPRDLWIESFSVYGSINLSGPQNRSVSFDIMGEGGGGSSVYISLPRTKERHLTINGWDATMFMMEEGAYNRVVLMWQIQDTLLELGTRNIGAEETIRLAESVAPCEKDPDRPYGVPLSHDPQGNVLPPREWTGLYFPAWLPEDCRMLVVDLGLNSIDLIQGQSGKMLHIREYLTFPPEFPSLGNAQEARMVDVKGRRGLLVVYEEPDSEFYSLDLFWEETMGVWISLSVDNVPEETLLQIAGSFRRISAEATDEPIGAE